MQIPYGRQDISKDDIDAVVKVLNSDFLTQGPAVPAFEKCISHLVSAKHTVAFSNATAALHGACLALGVGKGDLVWTSPITFVASANCALYCGAEVDFVDIDSGTLNLCPNALEEKLLLAKEQNRLPKVLIVVHMSGHVHELKRIRELANEYSIAVVEDASHGIGSKYLGEPTGNCRFSDITVFSFHPVKIVTTGEGGAATTNDPGLARKMELFRSHGISRDPLEMNSANMPAWYYEQILLGFNFRMTDIQAALGTSQLTRLNEFVSRRQQLAQTYDAAVELKGLGKQVLPKDCTSAFHLYIVRIAKDRDRVFKLLKENGIGANLHYIPVYRQPYYRALGFEPGYCPNAESYYSEAMTLPLFPKMKDIEQKFVISSLSEALG